MATILETKYFRLTQSNLSLKTYYFPTGQAKNIDIKSIRGIYWEDQNQPYQFGLTKGWGMSLSPCWWACDIIRNFHSGDKSYFNVVIDCGEQTFKGFTVNDINGFISAVLKLIGPDTQIVRGLPF